MPYLFLTVQKHSNSIGTLKTILLLQIPSTKHSELVWLLNFYLKRSGIIPFLPFSKHLVTGRSHVMGTAHKKIAQLLRSFQHFSSMVVPPASWMFHIRRSTAATWCTWSQLWKTLRKLDAVPDFECWNDTMTPPNKTKITWTSNSPIKNIKNIFRNA